MFINSSLCLKHRAYVGNVPEGACHLVGFKELIAQLPGSEITKIRCAFLFVFCLFTSLFCGFFNAL